MSFLDSFFKKPKNIKSSDKTLADLVFITDNNLKILSANSAVETVLGSSSSQLLERGLFDVLFLRDPKNLLASRDSLGIDAIISSKTELLIQNLVLLTKNSLTLYQVNVRIKPSINYQGQTDRLNFLVSDKNQPQNGNAEAPLDLESVIIKHKGVIKDIRGSLFGKGLTDIAIKLELAAETEEDIFRISEINSTEGFNAFASLVDTAQLCQRIIYGRTFLAQSFRVSLNYQVLNPPPANINQHIPQGSNISDNDLTSILFTTNVDLRWFDYLLQKLVSISMFLASSTAIPIVRLVLENVNHVITIRIYASSPAIPAPKLNMIFVQNFGDLGGETNLKLGSGLEGILAKTIAQKLNIPLSLNFDPQSSNLIISLELPSNQSPTTPAPTTSIKT